MVSHLRASILVLAAALSAVPASAQEPHEATAQANEREAETLFKTAVKQMREQQYSGACANLENAVRLFPAAAGAQKVLARCYESLGKPAAAFRQYVVARQVATHDKRTESKRTAERLQEIEESLKVLRPMLAKFTKLTLLVPDTLRAVDGLAIHLDGLPLEAADWDKPLPVDKGDHEITLSAPGHVEKKVPFVIDTDGTLRDVALPTLEAERAPVALSASSAPVPTGSAPPGAPPAAQASVGRSKAPGFVLGGVGVAGLAAGAALVGIAIGQGNDVHANVPRYANGEPRCGRSASTGEAPSCADFRSRAESASMMGNVGVGVLIGGGALTVAGVIYLLIPSAKPNSKPPRVVPVASQDGGGLFVTGSF